MVMDSDKNIQTLSSLMSAAFGFDVALINRKRITVAGTGTFQQYIGLPVPRYCIAAQNISAHESYVIENASDEPECYKCKLRERCPYNMAMGSPIVSSDIIEGTMLLLSTDIKQRNTMTKSICYLKKHLENISVLISDNISQNNLKLVSDSINESLTGFIDTFEEGIMMIGKDGKIDYINSVAENIFGCKNRETFNKDIDQIPFGSDFRKNLKKNSLVGNSYTPVFNLDKENGNKSINYSIKKILNANKFAGYVVRLNQKKEKSYFYSSHPDAGKGFENIVGNNITLNATIREAKKFANAESAVLLLGETGTGKDLFAGAIHQAGGRRNSPFITVNCSALPGNLLESEMFGYEEGAFTGAKTGGKPGKFELAHNGTLFLDEIGDLPSLLQAKLLRVFEDGMVEKIGCTSPIKVDVRLISATNKNLPDMIEKGTFRRDLYYRINAIPINIPPLRERKEDILLLANHFIFQFSKKLKTNPKILDQAVEDFFLQYPWAGNVRELKNIIDYLVQISCGDLITVDILPKSMRDLYLSMQITDPASISQPCMSELKFLEKNAIVEAIKRFGSTTEGKKLTAKYLGIGLTTLYRRLRFFKIICCDIK
jgi:transcriptional regulator with PAS, ATPase and Fis domain